ncbi:G:T/U mismatch-specific DNA glycosylase [Rhizobium leguminosarum bv. trifolii WSM2297]|uniref:G:T/U mismatch-specific DNA glycosylase n=1 Tax=Rhizobium leguminosarum bv. trifolii WSM2297 TaxID=754762 RepID=J0CAV2_RHILT|nr:G/U mismatch-specific DNA glycosylase [Rhizobium leguminosarum]EJC80217.1 G:T/U mismatch-specific DNA glycosylase [Rhizobium leguminosarum bv. trifolii WSM2297]
MSAVIDATARVNGFSDILAPGLSVIFCGLNPALSAVRDGHNFSNRSNRFWRVLHLAGFTPDLLRPEQEREILSYGFGLTTAVPRATKSASELTSQDYLSAASALERKIRELAPDNFAFLGKAGYAAIAARATVEWGRQPDKFAGASVWVLPNTSGLNRAFTLERLAEHFRELRSATS